MSAVTLTVPGVDEVVALDGRQLDDALWELEQARRLIVATQAAVVARSDASKQFAVDGHRSVRGWAMAVTNCSPGEATRHAQLARLLERTPLIGNELLAGRLGVAQAHELGRLVSNPRIGGHLPGSQDVLLDAARELEYLDFVVVTKRWEQLADAEGAHRDHERGDESRDARLSEVDGEYRWDTRHGPVHGAIMREIFQHFTQAQFRADWEATIAEHGAMATADLMPRTAAQRRADALMAIFERAAAAGIDGTPVEVVVNLVIDNDQFEQHLRNGVDDTPIDIDPATVRERRCETTEGVPVDPRVVVALALLGHVRRVVFDSAGVLVDAGRKRRLFTGPVREVLKVFALRCSWLGCTIRAAIAEIDHVSSHSDGGLTDAANAAIDCKYHNLFKYRSGYQPWRTDAGTWHIARPDGTRIAPPDAA